MNLGNIVNLDRTTGRGTLLVAEGTDLYRVSLGPNEVRLLPSWLAAGDRVLVEVLRGAEELKLVVARAP